MAIVEDRRPRSKCLSVESFRWVSVLPHLHHKYANKSTPPMFTMHGSPIKIRENYRQKEKQLSDWTDFVARTSNFQLLKVKYNSSKYSYHIRFSNMQAVFYEIDGQPAAVGDNTLCEVRRLSTPSFAEKKMMVDSYLTQWRWYWQDDSRIWNMYNKQTKGQTNGHAVTEPETQPIKTESSPKQKKQTTPKPAKPTKQEPAKKKKVLKEAEEEKKNVKNVPVPDDTDGWTTLVKGGKKKGGKKTETVEEKLTAEKIVEKVKEVTAAVVSEEPPQEQRNKKKQKKKAGKEADEVKVESSKPPVEPVKVSEPKQDEGKFEEASSKKAKSKKKADSQKEEVKVEAKKTEVKAKTEPKVQTEAKAKTDTKPKKSVETKTEAKQDVKPKDVKQEAKPKDAKKEPKAKETKQEAKPKEAKQEVKPKEAKQDAKPKEVKQEVKPKEAKQEVKPKETKADKQKEGKKEEAAKPKEDKSEGKTKKQTSESKPETTEPKKGKKAAEKSEAKAPTKPTTPDQPAKGTNDFVLINPQDVEPEKSSPVDSDKNSAGSDMSVSFDELGDSWVEAKPKSKKKKARREN
ncbi:unnamed protein product [Mytilus edulis]|uniref:Uncharacterized protein n=1 Tax=Mytilus edulis TaxID=6550 RepID=A0A8S3RQ78_MYTED|nr:unnamed protein product [Mytilus edulis]